VGNGSIVGQNAHLITKDSRTSQYTVSGFSASVSMQIDVQTDSALVAYMLVDLSNTSAWKHTDTGKIIIDYIIIQVDPTTSFLGEIKVGFLENVDGTDGDLCQLIDVDMKRKADIFSEVIEFGSHGMHCKSDSHFGPCVLNNAGLSSGTNLGGPDAFGTPTYPCGDGDLVLLIEGDGTNFVDVSLTIGYETVA